MNKSLRTKLDKLFEFEACCIIFGYGAMFGAYLMQRNWGAVSGWLAASAFVLLWYEVMQAQSRILNHWGESVELNKQLVEELNKHQKRDDADWWKDN